MAIFLSGASPRASRHSLQNMARKVCSIFSSAAAAPGNETLRWLSVLLYPVLPDASAKIYHQIGLTEDISTISPANLKWGELTQGTKIGNIEGVFPRLDKKIIMTEIEKTVSSSR